MKSDREFIEGIYKKAASCTQKRQGRSFPGRWAVIKRSLPVLAACLVLCLCIPAYFVWERGKIQDKPDSAAYGQDSRRGHDPLARGGQRGIQQSVIAGVVEKIKVVDGASYALVSCEKVYEGTMDGRLCVCYNTTGMEENEKIVMAEGEQVLLFLEEAQENQVFSEGNLQYGKVINGFYGKYTFLKEEDGDIIYQAADGATIASSLLEQ